MKRITTLGLAVIASLFLIPPVQADEPKNHDKDVVYDEAKVPPYDLPPLLVSSEGKAITTPEEWFNIRRPQIMALFGNLVYGIVPAPESPIKTTFDVVKTNRDFMDGKATRKDVRIRFENNKGSAEDVDRTTHSTTTRRTRKRPATSPEPRGVKSPSRNWPASRGDTPA